MRLMPDSSQTAAYLMRSMSDKKVKQHKKPRVIPGFGITLGTTVAMLSILILIPLGSVMVYAFCMTPREFWENVTSPGVIYAFGTSILTAFIAAVVNSVFGVILAWVLVRYEFPGKMLLDGLIELPFAIPTAVAGITLSKLYVRDGFLGAPLARLGITVSYTHIGITVAMIFVGIPFVVRSVQPVLEKLDPQFEEASYILGADSFSTFFKVILSELMPAILTGFGLALARGIGEYGSVIYIAGNSAREHTQVVSYIIMQKLNYMDYPGATAVAFVMLIISFVLLLLINIVQIRQSRRTNNI